MRYLLSAIFALSFYRLAHAQDVKPVIVGQKDLSTTQGVLITIQLTDLYVQETNSDDENEENSGENEEDDDESGQSDNDDEDKDDEDDEDNGSDNDDDEEGSNDDDDRDDDNDDRGSKGDKGNKDDKDDDDRDKGNKGDKKNKDKDKDKGNGRSTYPEGYVLEILAGDNYTYSGNTVAPAAAFTGTLTVKIRVRNEKYASPEYDLKISVLPGNDNQPPVIIGQVPLSILMDTSIEIELSHLQVDDADDEYPEGFSLIVRASANFSLSGATVIPAPGFTGDLLVPVVVNDGEDESEPFELKVAVTAASKNVAPNITAQVPLSISANQSVEIVLSHLVVTDPDNEYPRGFTLHVNAGKNYSLEGATVFPARDFSGELIVKVSVNDGNAESNLFDFRITVSPGANQRPVITGQTGIKIAEGETIEIDFHHLVVQDADNSYPDGFLIAVLTGENYIFENRTITPLQGFLGTLTVAVTVHDGKDASEPFGLKIEVIKPDRLEIVGQKTLEMVEDSIFQIKLSDLSINDPSHTYPDGFSLHVMGGNNYDVKNGGISPHHNFTGNLTVPITVSKEGNASDPFNLLIIVLPVNDAPELLNLENTPLVLTGPGPWPVSPHVEIADPDDEHLLLAEIGFNKTGYQPGLDQLEFEKPENIHGVFDREEGILFLVGRAAKEEYQQLLGSIRYVSTGGSDSLQLAGSRSIYFKLNDGKDWGPAYERVLVVEDHPALEIPSAFTPNNDQANDTWKIVFATYAEGVEAFVRVYDKKGLMVFEASDLQTEWDGHLNGSPLPSDSYFYTIELHLSHTKVNYKGIVSILR